MYKQQYLRIKERLEELKGPQIVPLTNKKLADYDKYFCNVNVLLLLGDTIFGDKDNNWYYGNLDGTEPEERRQVPISVLKEDYLYYLKIYNIAYPLEPKE